MSSDVIALKATERKELGKRVKALRRQGIVPANVYEKGKPSQAVSIDFIALTKAYRQAGKHHPIELDVDGKQHLVMIKDIDVNVAKNTLRHVGFHAVKRNEKVVAEVPVRIEGEIPAERVSLMVLQTLDTVEVEATPDNLPNELFVPGEKLAEDGDKVTVADIKLPDNVVMVSDLELPVATVETPRDQIAEADAALAEQQAAEGTEPEQVTDEAQPEESPSEEE